MRSYFSLHVFGVNIKLMHNYKKYKRHGQETFPEILKWHYHILNVGATTASGNINDFIYDLKKYFPKY